MTEEGERKKKYGEKAIEEAFQGPLEVWPAPHVEGFPTYIVHLEAPEFSCLCPRSGFPDTATIVIDYVPADLVVELKALKLYLNGFRMVGISHEAVVNTIAKAFDDAAHPTALRVSGFFGVRGNIFTRVTVERMAPTEDAGEWGKDVRYFPPIEPPSFRGF